MSAGREVLIEIQYLGNVARVAAVDAVTGVEVVVQGPASAARADLEALAMSKLEWAMGRRRSAKAPGGRRGKLV